MAGLDVGIDLGTTKIIVYMHGSGIVLNEPSVIAINTKKNEVLAVGNDAYNMLGKTPEYIVAENPLKDGVISNHKLTEYMIKEFLSKACKSLLVRPRVAICVPSGITDVESRAVVEAAEAAGARKVYLIEEPIAAAIGAGLDISKPIGRMLVDIGGGTMDAAVISLNGIVKKASIKAGGNALDQAIVRHFQINHKLLIGERMAERVKKEIATVFRPDESITTEVKGRNLINGLPKKIIVTQKDIYKALIGNAMEIVQTIKFILEDTPPELTGDIYQSGIVMTGGGALLKGLDQLIAQETKLKVQVASNPIECVAVGTGNCFDHLNNLGTGFQDISSRHK